MVLGGFDSNDYDQSLRFSIEPNVRIFRVFNFGRVGVSKTKLLVGIFKRFRVLFSLKF